VIAVLRSDLHIAAPSVLMSESNNESRGAYREAPTDEPDVVEVKKMLSTGPSGEAAPTQFPLSFVTA